MLERVIFSGSGGQGLMFIGKLLANMMLDKSPNITFFPSYGAEVRGGTSNCQVILSSDEIASPVVSKADTLVLMNQPSVERFISSIDENGTAFINSSMADVDSNGTNIVAIEASDIAHEIGSVRSANVVLFGAYLGKADLIGYDEALAFVAETSATKGKKAEELNSIAFEKGWAITSK